VFIDHGQLKTNSVVLAEKFQRPHRNVMQSLKALRDEGYINEQEILPISYVDVRNRKKPMFELTERAFLIAMPFIGGTNAKKGQIALVDAFLSQRALLNSQHNQLQKELQEFTLACRYSEERGSVAGKALRKRRDEIVKLSARKVELENKYQLQLGFKG